jgi:hypothetical protein
MKNCSCIYQVPYFPVGQGLECGMCFFGSFICSYKEMNSPLGEIIYLFISLYHYRQTSNHDYEGRGRQASIRKICLPKPLLTLKDTPITACLGPKACGKPLNGRKIRNHGVGDELHLYKLFNSAFLLFLDLPVETTQQTQEKTLPHARNY